MVGFDGGIALSSGYLETASDGNIFGSGYAKEFSSETGGELTNAAFYSFNPNYEFYDASLLQFDLTPTNGEAGYVSFQ